MTSMCAADVVKIGQVHADARSGGLFPGVEMYETGNQAGGELIVDSVFEDPNGFHLSIGIQEFRFSERRTGDGGCHGVSSAKVN